MLSHIAACTIAPTPAIPGEVRMFPGIAHKITYWIDMLAGITLCTIGVCALECNFMSTDAVHALLGVGFTHLTFMLSRTILLIKGKKAPNSYLIK